MNVPANLKYTKSHKWVEFSGGIAKVGLSDFAQHKMKNIVFLTLPDVGDAVDLGAPFGEAESVKTTSALDCPVSGVVTAVNEALLDDPEAINRAPYDSWLIEVGQITATDEELMDADAFTAYCQE